MRRRAGRSRRWIRSPMPEFDVTYTINNHPCHYTVKGELAPQSDRRLIEEDDNLLQGRRSEPEGYEAIRPWDAEMMEGLQAAVAQVISDAIKETCGRAPDFTLEQYHGVVSNDE